MSHEVIFAATARRNLERIPPRIVPAIVEFVFGDLAQTPKMVGKPLKQQLEGSYSHIDEVANRIEIMQVDHEPTSTSAVDPLWVSRT